MFLARIVFFRLHESPRYLVHAGRPLEAIESLQLISRFNGSDLSIEIEDVADHHPPAKDQPLDDPLPPRPTSTTRFNATGSELDPDHIPSSHPAGSPGAGTSGRYRPVLTTQYSAIPSSAIPVDGSSSTREPDTSLAAEMDDSTYPRGELVKDVVPTKKPLSHRTLSFASASSARSRRRDSHRDPPSRQAPPSGCMHSLRQRLRPPRWLRRPLHAWWERVMMVLSPEWRRTTVVMWVVWFGMSLGECLLSLFLWSWALISSWFDSVHDVQCVSAQIIRDGGSESWEGRRY